MYGSSSCTTKSILLSYKNYSSITHGHLGITLSTNLQYYTDSILSYSVLINIPFEFKTSSYLHTPTIKKQPGNIFLHYSSCFICPM